MRLTLMLGLMVCSGCGSFSKMFPAKSPQLPALSEIETTRATPQTLDVTIETPSDANAVTLAAAIDRDQASPGGELTLVVRCRTAKPWYIYAVDGPEGVGVPTRLELFLPAGFSQTAAWSLPVAHKKSSVLGEVAYYADDMRFTVPLQMAETVSTGKTELQCTVHYQACSDTTCLAPASKTLTIPVTVE